MVRSHKDYFYLTYWHWRFWESNSNLITANNLYCHCTKPPLLVLLLQLIPLHIAPVIIILRTSLSLMSYLTFLPIPENILIQNIVVFTKLPIAYYQPFLVLHHKCPDCLSVVYTHYIAITTYIIISIIFYMGSMLLTLYLDKLVHS